MGNIIVQGIEIIVARKNIKNINLRIMPPDGKVKVSAPRKISDQIIIDFVNSRIDWIVKHKEKFALKPRPHIRYVDGDNIIILGNEYKLRLSTTLHRINIQLAGNEILLSRPINSNLESISKHLNLFYKKLLMQKLLELADKWQEYMGLYAKSFTIRDLKSRWGTCNVRSGKITINLHLIKLPIEHLEYVIVHELLHLRISNHGDEFKSLLTKYYPDWKRVKKSLKERGAEHLW